jgi:hypothetical protein
MSARKIAPQYTFRFSTEDIRATYGSSDGAFVAGDYLNAAQWAPAQSELKGCALILGGLLEQGLAILDEQGDLGGRSQLCRAFALWSLGHLAEADAALAEVRDPEFAAAAQRFRQLLGRKNINIFVTGAILSVFPEHYSKSFIAPVHKYGTITVKYVGSQLAENAYDYFVTESLAEFIEALPASEKPDILFALSPQWLVASDFHKVTVPRVIWCHDSDAFQYRNVDNYALYDVAICNCSQEHFELKHGTPGLFCAANMLLHPLATPFPEASSHREKTYDVIFTGSALAPFHSEKPRFLYNLAELGSRYKVQVIEGHMPERQYFETISHAKFLPVVNRYAGSPSPRWRDALANGAFLLYPEDSFYGEIAPGCFPFRAETLVADASAHIDRFNAGCDPAYDLSTVVPEVNERFAIHRQPREESYTRLLKYALFMALIFPRATAARTSRQRRLVWLTPAVDCGLFGTNHVRDRIGHTADRIDVGDLGDDIDYNNAAHLYAQMVFTFQESKEARAWAARANRYFRQGLARFPDSLTLLFNEAHWTFLRPGADHVDAERKFRDIIERFEELKFDPHGADIALAYTLHERDAVFPCYEYSDVATSEMVLANTPQLAGKTLPHSTRDIILSACYGYVGWARLKRNDTAGGIANLKAAIEIYPHGLPVLRLYFDTLLKLSAEVGRLTSELASDLAEAFIAVVNVNPSILLSHVYTIVPILADNGERQAARDVLAAWFRLANIMHRLQTDDEKHQIALLAILWEYNWLLPSALVKRVEMGLWGKHSVRDLTQLEQRFIRAAGIVSVRRKRRKYWPWRSKRPTAADHVAWLLTDSGYGHERIALNKLRRALQVWALAPADVRAVYRNKAYRMLGRGEFMQVLRRIQQWGTSSRWSSAVVAVPRRRHWGPLQKLLEWWTQLGSSQRRSG